MATPDRHINMSTLDAQSFEERIVLTDANKTKDGMATIYRIKHAEAPAGPQLELQFGKSMEEDDRLPISLLTFDETKQHPGQLLVAQIDPVIAQNLADLFKAVGTKLYAGREVYFNGQVPRSMSLDEFLAMGTEMVKSNRYSDLPEVFLKTRESSRFYQVRTKEDGTFARRVLPPVDRPSLSFNGITCVVPGVHAGMNKGSPRWGIFLTVLDAYLIPCERPRTAFVDANSGCRTGVDMLDDSDDSAWELPDASPKPALVSRKRIEPSPADGPAAKRATFTHAGKTAFL